MITETDETKASKHLILLGRILLPIMALLALWGMKTVGIMLSSVKLETIENNQEATQMIFVWTAFVVIAVLTYKVGVRFNLWKNIGVSERAKERTTFYSSSGGRKRFSLAAAVWTSVGLALLGLLVLKAWHEFEFGLSNAPERFALRGYVPRESVAAALAAVAPTLPEVHIVIAPPLGTNGVTNWSDGVARSEGLNMYFSAPDGMGEFVEVQLDGMATTNFLSLHKVKPAVCNFRSQTNAIKIKWWQSSRNMTSQEIAKFLENN